MATSVGFRYTRVSEAALSRKGQQYRARLRSLVRGLWSGVISVDSFLDEIIIVIDEGLTTAWNEGAKTCGIKPDEKSEEEQAALDDAIAREQGFVFKFSGDIEAGSKANKGKLAPLMFRVDIWANRYLDVQNQAKLMACENQKYRWDLGDTEHCPSCLKLAGRVARAKTWLDKGIQPQSPPNGYLKCGGWRCGCSFTPTDEPVTKGRWPSLP